MIIWTPEMDRLLGVISDSAISKRFNIARSSVYKRKKVKYPKDKLKLIKEKLIISEEDLAQINLRAKFSYAYNSHKSMMGRMNPNNENFKRYGGRGITICEKWVGVDGFKNFLRDMGDRPQGYTIDRIDNDKGYEPDNCKWSTPSEQNRNQRLRNPNGIKYIYKTKKTWRVGRHINGTYLSWSFKNKEEAEEFNSSINQTIINKKINQILSKIKYSGVTYNKNNGKYQSYISKNYLYIHIGYFNQPIEAARYRNQVLWECGMDDMIEEIDESLNDKIIAYNLGRNK